MGEDQLLCSEAAVEPRVKDDESVPDADYTGDESPSSEEASKPAGAGAVPPGFPPGMFIMPPGGTFPGMQWPVMPVDPSNPKQQEFSAAMVAASTHQLMQMAAAATAAGPGNEQQVAWLNQLAASFPYAAAGCVPPGAQPIPGGKNARSKLARPASSKAAKGSPPTPGGSSGGGGESQGRKASAWRPGSQAVASAEDADLQMGGNASVPGPQFRRCPVCKVRKNGKCGTVLASPKCFRRVGTWAPRASAPYSWPGVDGVPGDPSTSPSPTPKGGAGKGEERPSARADAEEHAAALLDLGSPRKPPPGAGFHDDEPPSPSSGGGGGGGKGTNSAPSGSHVPRSTRSGRRVGRSTPVDSAAAAAAATPGGLGGGPGAVTAPSATPAVRSAGTPTTGRRSKTIRQSGGERAPAAEDAASFLSELAAAVELAEDEGAAGEEQALAGSGGASGGGGSGVDMATSSDDDDSARMEVEDGGGNRAAAERPRQQARGRRQQQQQQQQQDDDDDDDEVEVEEQEGGPASRQGAPNGGDASEGGGDSKDGHPAHQQPPRDGDPTQQKAYLRVVGNRESAKRSRERKLERMKKLEEAVGQVKDVLVKEAGRIPEDILKALIGVLPADAPAPASGGGGGGARGGSRSPRGAAAEEEDGGGGGGGGGCVSGGERGGAQGMDVDSAEGAADENGDGASSPHPAPGAGEAGAMEVGGRAQAAAARVGGDLQRRRGSRQDLRLQEIPSADGGPDQAGGLLVAAAVKPLPWADRHTLGPSSPVAAGSRGEEGDDGEEGDPAHHHHHHHHLGEEDDTEGSNTTGPCTSSGMPAAAAAAKVAAATTLVPGNGGAPPISPRKRKLIVDMGGGAEDCSGLTSPLKRGNSGDNKNKTHPVVAGSQARPDPPPAATGAAAKLKPAGAGGRKGAHRPTPHRPSSGPAGGPVRALSEGSSDLGERGGGPGGGGHTAPPTPAGGAQLAHIDPPSPPNEDGEQQQPPPQRQSRRPPVAATS